MNHPELLWTGVTSDYGRAHAGKAVIGKNLFRRGVRATRFENLPSEKASHSCEHAALNFHNNLVVVGSRQRAREVSVLLKEAGAEIEMINRGGIDWTGSETPGGGGGIGGALLRHLRPPSPIGPFAIHRLIVEPGFQRRRRDYAHNMVSNLSQRPTAAVRLRPRCQGSRMSDGRSGASVRLTGHSSYAIARAALRT